MEESMHFFILTYIIIITNINNFACECFWTYGVRLTKQHCRMFKNSFGTFHQYMG